MHHPGDHHHQNKTALCTVLIVTVAFFFVEVIGGFWTNSLALLSDAGHMLSDIAALGLSLGAIWFSVKPAHEGKTFGYFRAEILVAFVNGGILIAIATVIFHEAYHRILSPQEVKAIPMVGIATAGLIVNLFAVILLFKGSTYSMNIRAVLFHVAGDALGSLGAITAGVVIWLRGWNWFDPLISFFIGSIIIYGAWHLLWETTHILMQGTPSHLQTNEIKQDMMNVEGVHCVNDLHIWTLTSHVDILTAHVVVNDVRNGMNILTDLHVLLRNKYGLEHVTIQLEEESMGNCRLFD